jgi:hypothetical protein
MNLRRRSAETIRRAQIAAPVECRQFDDIPARRLPMKSPAGATLPPARSGGLDPSHRRLSLAIPPEDHHTA